MGSPILYEGTYTFKGSKDKSSHILKSKRNKWGHNFGIFFNSYDLIFYMKLKFSSKSFLKIELENFIHKKEDIYALN